MALGARYTFSNPDKLETWLGQSGFYESFVTNALKETEAGAGSDASGLTYTNPDVKAAADSAFTKEFVQQQVHTFLQSNYGWLEGKADKPNFKLDFTAAKQQFAANIGTTVQTRLTGLPECTDGQIARLRAAGTTAIDPLTVPCRPAGLNIAAEAARLQATVAENSQLLPNTVLTQDNLNADKTAQNEPYYERLSWLPKVYQLALVLPYIFAALGIVSLIGIIFASIKRRAGIKKVSVTLLLAGVILVAMKLGTDYALTKLEDVIFPAGTSASGPLQLSLTGFLEHVVRSFTLANFLCGLGFMLAGVVGFAILIATEKPGQATPPKTPKTPDGPTELVPTTTEAPTAPTIPERERLEQPPRPSQPPRRPRLIQ